MEEQAQATKPIGEESLWRRCQVVGEITGRQPESVLKVVRGKRKSEKVLACYYGYVRGREKIIERLAAKYGTQPVTDSAK